MQKLTVRDVQFAGKRVLVRVDFNVPLAGTAVSDDTRIRAAVPTIKYIMDQQPRAIILMSHLGRPKGERIAKMSLAPVVPVLSLLLDTSVAFSDDCIGPSIETAIEELEESGIILLENTRFHMAGKPRTIPNSPGNWRNMAIYLSMTPLVQPTAPTRQTSVYRHI